MFSPVRGSTVEVLDGGGQAGKAPLSYDGPEGGVHHAAEGGGGQQQQEEERHGGLPSAPEPCYQGACCTVCSVQCARQFWPALKYLSSRTLSG
jgi:hypothetical protein